MQKLIEKRQVSMTQKNETRMVSDELNLLEEDAKVFKLVGPVLTKVDLDEAKANVGERLKWIETQM